MTPATVLVILEIINGLLTAAKEAPTVLEEVRSLIAKVGPHVEDAGDAAKNAFQAVLAKEAQT